MTELICRVDSSIREIEASVLECVVKNGKYHVVFDRTVIYPGGGGQPADSGTVGDFEIQDVFLRPDGAVEHVLAGPVSKKAVIRVDWEKRLDYMQQHTAQHLLTAIAGRMSGLTTTAFHLNRDRSDIEFDRPEVEQDCLAALEEAVNKEILADHPVRTLYVTRERMLTMNVRSRLLPDGFDGPFRLVEIGDVDLNTCGGTHVASTGQIQVLKILGQERLTRGVRVHYAAGRRVRMIMDEMLSREVAIGAALTTGPRDFLASIESLKKASRDNEGAARAMSIRLAEKIVERMVEDAGADRIAVFHHDEPDGEFLRLVGDGFRKAGPGAVALITGGATKGLFMVAGPDGIVSGVGPDVARILDGRGGGRGGVFQGRAGSLSLWSDAVERIRIELSRHPEDIHPLP